MADAPGTLTCSQCGAASPASQRFCGNCGAKLESPATPSPSIPEQAEALVAEATVPDERPTPVTSVQNAPMPTPTPAKLEGGRPIGLTKAIGIPEDASRFVDPARERDRLLTLANVQRVRGQLAEARKSVETVLSLSDNLPNRELAPIHELLGDILQAEGKWEEAQAAFEKAHMIDTERVGAEKKFAEATLRIAEAKAIASGSMLGMPSESFGSGTFGNRARGKRNSGVAVIASLFVPGFGQFVNGELVKGGVCLGVFLLTMVALCLSPDSVVFFAKINAMVAPNGPAAARALDPLSPLMIALLILLTANWGYSLFDAAAGASKSEGDSKGAVPPAGDRSGWEV